MYYRRRRCSYCGDTGHNKRGCSSRKGAVKAYCQQRAADRKIILQLMKENGLSIGTVLRWREELFFIKDIIWKNIGTNSHYFSFVASRLNQFDHNIYFDMPQAALPENLRDSWRDEITIVNPVDTSTIENSIPDDWYTGELGEIPMYLR